MIFLKGFMVGFLLCAPLGPIGVLSVRRTLTDGRLAGILSVLGASCVDALYCSLAGLGMASVSELLRKEKLLFQCLGGLLLLALGILIFASRRQPRVPQPSSRGLFGSFTATFLLTLANPLPILVFTAALGALGVHGWKEQAFPMAVLVWGVFVGSGSWAPILALGVGLFEHLVDPGHMGLVNRVSGVVLFGFGLVLLVLALT